MRPDGMRADVFGNLWISSNAPLGYAGVLCLTKEGKLIGRIRLPLARYDASRDVLELYGATKVPHRNRDALARMLGRSAAGVVLKEGNTGGGFGVRGELYPEDFLV